MPELGGGWRARARICPQKVTFLADQRKGMALARLFAVLLAVGKRPLAAALGCANAADLSLLCGLHNGGQPACAYFYPLWLCFFLPDGLALASADEPVNAGEPTSAGAVSAAIGLLRD